MEKELKKLCKETYTTIEQNTHQYEKSTKRQEKL